MVSLWIGSKYLHYLDTIKAAFVTHGRLESLLSIFPRTCILLDSSLSPLAMNPLIPDGVRYCKSVVCRVRFDTGSPPCQSRVGERCYRTPMLCCLLVGYSSKTNRRGSSEYRSHRSWDYRFERPGFTYGDEFLSFGNSGCWLNEHQCRLFDNFLNRLQKFSSDDPIDDTMIAA